MPHTHIDGVDPSSLPSPAEAGPLGASLGLPATMMYDVVDEWMLTLSGGILQFSKAVHDQPDIMEKATDMFLENLTIRTWTESRWLTVGQSCRGLVLSLLWGLKPFVMWLKQQGTSQWHLKGFEVLFQKDSLACVLVAALSSHVSDTVLAMMLQDSRACLHWKEWQSQALEELQWLEAMPCCCLARLC